MDLIDIAKKYLGYRERGINNTIFGEYMHANNAPWCHSFVSYCAFKACILGSLVPSTPSTTTGMNWYIQKGRFGYKGQYTPKRNDIVYFKTNRSHVGIVEYVSGGVVHTIEGNSSDMVKRRSYSLNEPTITGYGKVADYMDNRDYNPSVVDEQNRGKTRR